MVAFLVLLAVFFGNTAAPALAHADGAGGRGSFAHATEVVDIHDDAAPRASAEGEAQPDTKDSGGSQSAAFHHHCTCATKAEYPAQEIDGLPSAEIFHDAPVAALPSRRSAPLTEPPAA